MSCYANQRDSQNPGKNAQPHAAPPRARISTKAEFPLAAACALARTGLGVCQGIRDTTEVSARLVGVGLLLLPGVLQNMEFGLDISGGKIDRVAVRVDPADALFGEARLLPRLLRPCRPALLVSVSLREDGQRWAVMGNDGQ